METFLMLSLGWWIIGFITTMVHGLVCNDFNGERFRDWAFIGLLGPIVPMAWFFWRKDIRRNL